MQEWDRGSCSLLVNAQRVRARTDVRKLSVLEDDEVVVQAQFLQTFDERGLKVLDDINMGLETSD